MQGNFSPPRRAGGESHKRKWSVRLSGIRDGILLLPAWASSTYQNIRPLGEAARGTITRILPNLTAEKRNPTPRAYKEKSPKDLMALRASERMRILPVSAGVVTVSILTPTTLAAVVTLARIGAITIIRTATRGGVNHRTTRRRSVDHARRAIRDRRRAVNDRRQATRCGHHDRGREQKRRPEREVQRPTRLRRGGEPSDGNCGNQTEDMFFLHERFDEVFMGFFNELKKRKVAEFESVSEQGKENE